MNPRAAVSQKHMHARVRAPTHTRETFMTSCLKVAVSALQLNNCSCVHLIGSLTIEPLIKATLLIALRGTKKKSINAIRKFLLVDICYTAFSRMA